MGLTAEAHDDDPPDQRTARTAEPVAIMLVVLFPTQVPPSFAGFDTTPDGLEVIPAGDIQARMSQLREVELAVLGGPYLDSRRLARWPAGRLRLPALAGGTGPSDGDLFLVTHMAGVALWEAWLPVPAQPLDADRLTGWLQPDVDGGLVSALRAQIGRIDRSLSPLPALEEGFPFTILRFPGAAATVDDVAAQYGPDLVRLLYVDRSRLPFKPAVVAEELGRDFCLRAGGISLLSQRGGLDVRTGESLSSGDGTSPVLPPRSALPLLVAIELLLIERGVLKLFDGRLSVAMPSSVLRLLELKQAVLDGLGEYRGAMATSNRFNRAVTEYGEEVLGLNDLYRALSDKLDGVTFEITTRYQQTTNVLQFWLTLLFTVLDAAALAVSLAIVHYGAYGGHAVLPIAAWALGAGLATAAAVTLLLRRKLG